MRPPAPPYFFHAPLPLIQFSGPLRTAVSLLVLTLKSWSLMNSPWLCHCDYSICRCTFFWMISGRHGLDLEWWQKRYPDALSHCKRTIWCRLRVSATLRCLLICWLFAVKVIKQTVVKRSADVNLNLAISCLYSIITIKSACKTIWQIYWFYSGTRHRQSTFSNRQSNNAKQFTLFHCKLKRYLFLKSFPP